MHLPEAQFQRVGKALADPQRFAVLEMVARCGGELACRRIIESSRLSPATISHHIKELTTAQLIEVRREGQYAYLTARTDTLGAYFDELQRRLGATRRPVEATCPPPE